MQLDLTYKYKILILKIMINLNVDADLKQVPARKYRKNFSELIRY